MIRATAHLGMNPTCDLQQAAELMKVHPKTVEDLIRRGVLRAGKVGRSWVLMTADILEYLERLIVRQTIERTSRVVVRVRRRAPALTTASSPN